MQYHPPSGSTDPNAPYIGKNVSAGILGSKVPPGAAEFPQREIVNAITQSGQTPSDTDQNQLTRAIRGGQLDFDATDIGSADAVICQVGLAHTQLAAGLPFTFIKGAAANTGNAVPTLTITDLAGNNGLTGTIVKATGGALKGGDLPANALITVRARAAGVFALVSLVALSDTSNAFVIGADTGTAGVIKVLTPIPSVAAPRQWMTVVTTPAFVNTGPTTLTIGGVTAPVVYGGGVGGAATGFLGGEMQPVPQEFIYDGANWRWQGQQSPFLNAGTTLNYYVATTGSDTNNGLTSATPYRTINKAIAVANIVNQNNQTITINVADGTFDPFALSGQFSGPIVVKSTSQNPANCIISNSLANTNCITANGSPITLIVSGFRLTNSGPSGQVGLMLSQSGATIYFNNMDFGPIGLTGQAQVYCNSANVSAQGDYTISGSAAYHLVAAGKSNAFMSPAGGNTVQFVGTPAFATAFVYSYDTALARFAGAAFGGSCTGSRYLVASGGVVNNGGASLPGSTAGTNSGGYVV